MIIKVENKEYKVNDSITALNVLKNSNMFSEGKTIDEWLKGVRERVWRLYGVYLILGDYDEILNQMNHLGLIKIIHKKDL